MTLNQVITEIASYLVARLNALKTYVGTVKTQLETAIAQEASARQAADSALQTALNQEIAARIAADAALDARIDGVVADLSAEVSRATAAETALGSRIDTETAARIAGDASVLAQAIAASKMNVRQAFFYDLGQGGTSIESIVGAGLDDGAYQVFFSGGAQVVGTITGLKDVTGTSFSGSVSNGDIYYFNVSGGVVTDGILADDKNQVKFDLVDTEIDTLKGRVSATETAIANLDSTYATDVQVADSIYNAFAAFKAALEGSGYTDPN